jgi:hypothetical protein
VGEDCVLEFSPVGVVVEAAAHLQQVGDGDLEPAKSRKCKKHSKWRATFKSLILTPEIFPTSPHEVCASS